MERQTPQINQVERRSMQVQTGFEAPRRSVLRYFGGKWSLAPWVLQHLPQAHRIYVEPFGGAASILMRKPRSKVEVYNDLDEEIVGIFQVLQCPVQCQALVRRLKRTPYSRGEFERAFIRTDDPVVRAQRAIVRAYQSMHHSALFNPKKTTFADARHLSGSAKSREWASYPRSLVAVHRRLQGVVIERRDALEVIRVQDSPETLFYVDPPYVPAARSSAGYRHELDTAQHQALLGALKSVRGMVVLSGYPSPLYDSELVGWLRVEREHNAMAIKAQPRTEVLWISPSAANRLRDEAQA
jgi:DNA adenine methylase